MKVVQVIGLKQNMITMENLKIMKRQLAILLWKLTKHLFFLMVKNPKIAFVQAKIYYRFYKMMLARQKKRDKIDFELRSLLSDKYMDVQNGVYKTPNIVENCGFKLNLDLYNQVIAAKKNRIYQNL